MIDKYKKPMYHIPFIQEPFQENDSRNETSKEVIMSKWIWKNKEGIGAGIFIWLAIGFICGILNSIEIRNSTDEKLPAGCVYKSAVSLISPGYIASCELFRRRWHVDGVQDFFQKK